MAWAEAVSAAAPTEAAPPRDDGWLTPIAQGLDWLLLYFQAQLNAAHVPYASGWAIVCLTLVTKTLTFPFTKIQVESALSTQKLKPTIDAIKRLYGDDRDKVQRETSALYKKSGVSPTAGCLPTLATIPVFWGLYRTLSNASSDGALTGGFYWLPDLAGPTSLAAQKAGAGISWLYPLVDGAPAVGWETAARYLVLPALLVGAQYASSAIISPPVNPDDDSAKTTKALLAFLPLMVGYFALNVPSGLSLYYFANTVITSGQQIWLRKLGGASAFEWQEEIGVNQARRTGPLAEPVLALQPAAAPASPMKDVGMIAGCDAA
ncbi:hypothetical protein WJX81_004886 [Elliptochloris bilobata]|uniref:Membrane insertase YidC/Oxa/ALB C-terminal domain-containing protein n=1 Tax=Elliptochloris bilobata TaxID=381761 RepID=A0AAW1SB74_9CHLO